MSHLTRSESQFCCDRFLAGLFGAENYEKWKKFKLIMNFETEQDFVGWILEVIQIQSDADREMCAADDGKAVELPTEHPHHPAASSDMIKAETAVAAVFEHQALDGVECVGSGKPEAEVSLSDAYYHPSSVVATLASNLEERPYGCGQCSSTFRTRAAMVQHEMTVHADGRQYTCGQCGGQFGSRADRLKHERDSHQDVTQYQQCSLCGEKFAAKHSLRRHHQTVHRRIKNFSCSHCGRMFALNHHLKHHIETVHYGIKKYACDYCAKTFNQKQTLMKHMTKCSTPQQQALAEPSGGLQEQIVE